MKKTNFIVRYSGSPLKYSFDEVNHDKGVALVEIDGEGNVSYEHQKLTPKKDLKVVEGTVEELQNFSRTEDYIFANLTDKKYVLNAVDKLRNAAFPNILGINFTNLEKAASNFQNADRFKEGASPFDNFAEFYKETVGEDLNDEQAKNLRDFLAELERN